MRSAIIATALILGMPAAANAADITVLTPGLAAPILKALATDWTQATGNKVTFIAGTVGKVQDDVAAGIAGDVVVLPDLTALSAKLKPGTTIQLGRAGFGLAVKAGAPHPDISTMEKLAALLKAAPGLAFTDPAIGSMSGTAIANMLKRPEFAGVKPIPLKGMPGTLVARGDAQYAAGDIPEELLPGSEAIPFPAALGLHIDFSGAVLAGAAAPADAAAFLAYISGPDARATWTRFGVEPSGRP